MKNKIKTIITYGTFDLLHYGHIEILRRARQLGGELIVGLSTDSFNKVKDKKCVFSYEKRRQMLESIKYVDHIIPEDGWIQKRQDIKDNKVDIFVMGDDWSGKFDDLSDLCEVVYLSRTKGVSTTELKLIRDK
jgi:glycerol-3-phosphate cytidylyltransferase